MREIEIGTRTVGLGHPCFVIAEAGVNHNGELSRAIELIEKAAAAGVDAVKFQTYKASKLVVRDAPRFWDWEGESDSEGTQYDSYSQLDGLPLDAYPVMFNRCEELGVEFMSTPFDFESADFLDELGMRAYKIASCDLTNHPFLAHVASKGKPMFLSTGTSTIEEIQAAVNVVQKAGNEKLMLMHCTLTYPTPYKDSNLRMMQTMMETWPDIPIGLSDHTLGISIPVAAAALGATSLEKHYTVDKTLPMSADHWLSVDPPEVTMMIEMMRQVEVGLGSAEKKPVESELIAMSNARRSVVSACNIPLGTKITEDMLTQKRPGHGISPIEQHKVVGMKAKVDITEDRLILWDQLE
ncbi:MAG: N-acetylneuraminate synthase family protein [Candidatus Thalassarchaeaceae archaeon]|jgi:sialic acid synthase SpsE|nr:N-acetylneuraminate synthase family protein [Candidatus Thalassarchaeaceae archaeon]